MTEPHSGILLASALVAVIELVTICATSIAAIPQLPTPETAGIESAASAPEFVSGPAEESLLREVTSTCSHHY
jgi:hypothetical protein